MSTKIRMARGGAKNRPYYRIVVADSRASRDGKFIERIGSFDPLQPKDSPERLKLDKERVQEWLNKGAIPSGRIATFLRQLGIGQDLRQVKLVNDNRAARIELKKEEIAARKKVEAEAEAKAAAEAKVKAEEAAKAKAEADAAAKVEADAKAAEEAKAKAEAEAAAAAQPAPEAAPATAEEAKPAEAAVPTAEGESTPAA